MIWLINDYNVCSVFEGVCACSSFDQALDFGSQEWANSVSHLQWVATLWIFSSILWYEMNINPPGFEHLIRFEVNLMATFVFMPTLIVASWQTHSTYGSFVIILVFDLWIVTVSGSVASILHSFWKVQLISFTNVTHSTFFFC